MKTTARGALALAGTAAILSSAAITASPASAAEVEREPSGTCSSGARWDFNVEREFGVVDIDFEIDGSPARQKWTVRIEKNGAKILRTSVVADNDGEVDVSHLVRDSAGVDRFSVRATSASGQVCRAALRI